MRMSVPLRLLQTGDRTWNPRQTTPGAGDLGDRRLPRRLLEGAVAAGRLADLARSVLNRGRLSAAGNYLFIFVAAAISSLPPAVLIVSCTCSPLWPPGIAAAMRLPFFGSACTASSNNTASPRFSVTRSGVGRLDAEELQVHAGRLGRQIDQDVAVRMGHVVHADGRAVGFRDRHFARAGNSALWKNWSETPAHNST